MIEIVGSAENIHINNDADADADTENIPINGDTNNGKDSTPSDENQNVKDKKVDASKTCEKTENADLASDLKAMKIIHPLQYRWAFWYLKGDRSKDWVDCLKRIAPFDTVEDFWGLYNHIQSASSLGWGSDYYIFKDGIQPMWEDPHNISGGRWLVNIDKQERNSKLDKNWLELLIALVGGQFDDLGEYICGAAVNVRQKGDKVALWTRNADDEHDETNRRIGKILKDKLGLKQLIQYVAHKDSSSKRGSSIRPKLSIQDI